MASRGGDQSAEVAARAADFAEEVKRITEGRLCDVILDMVGGSYIPRNHEAAAQDAKKNCPVSQALTGTTITLEASLA